MQQLKKLIKKKLRNMLFESKTQTQNHKTKSNLFSRHMYVCSIDHPVLNSFFRLAPDVEFPDGHPMLSQLKPCEQFLIKTSLN